MRGRLLANLEQHLRIRILRARQRRIPERRRLAAAQRIGVIRTLGCRELGNASPQILLTFDQFDGGVRRSHDAAAREQLEHLLGPQPFGRFERRVRPATHRLVRASCA